MLQISVNILFISGEYFDYKIEGNIDNIISHAVLALFLTYILTDCKDTEALLMSPLKMVVCVYICIYIYIYVLKCFKD
jgi:hypothetical protein